jgi:lipopolysaccharide/colanic/teichoic acid biosynthesis glycosyltransferase
MPDEWKLQGLVCVPEPAQGIAVTFCPGRVEELSIRIFDVVFATVALLLLLIPIIAVTVLVKVDSPGPVFFVQERLGRFRASFRCIKFRTMFDHAERHTGPICASKNDARVTRIGRFLRRCRLDELPQLLNVLRGDMSIVGPRPIRQYFADQLVAIEPLYDLRFAVKPGITGWAQVKYKYATTPEEELVKYNYDMHYVKNRSLLLNVRIILLTIGDVCGLKGM